MSCMTLSSTSPIGRIGPWKRYNILGHTTYARESRKQYGSGVLKNNLDKVSEAVDTLGVTKWRINKRLLNAAMTIWDKGGGFAGLIDRTNVPMPQKPLSSDVLENEKWISSVANTKKINRDKRSICCETEIWLSIAQKKKDKESFSFLHRIDFCGRAYPQNVYLNYQNTDICRGILEFAEGRPLGKSGLHWLKIHLANLYGGDVRKLPHERRLAFVDDHLNEIFDSAEKPVDGDCWWATAENPFQCLSACFNLSDALKNSSPCTVISHVPIHKDAPCSGLQHYAALGRDSLEAGAVDLIPGDKPSDVYAEVARRVRSIMKSDSCRNPAIDKNAFFAKMLIDQVDRKLLKPTVMTSLYGVTYGGACEQIKQGLKQLGLFKDESVRLGAASYGAKVTMEVLEGLLQSSRRIMCWLGKCAKVIAYKNQPVAWTTPIGLHVVQPYCISLQQRIIDDKRQISAFPPNFIHSLESSHMMMTAIECKNAGISFAGVHDSFWTHACDIDTMNSILRENFFEMYSAPILEDLLESFETSNPTMVFPCIPERGDFDLEQVLHSPYFFH